MLVQSSRPRDPLRTRHFVAAATVVLHAGIFVPAVYAQEAETAEEGLGLQPILPDLEGIVKDVEWARILGKAFFWDEQVGSDGMACASCHFAAGADSRIKNQLNPGFNQVTIDPETGEQVSDEDHTFGDAAGLRGSGLAAGANVDAEPGDFPFQRRADESDRDSPLTFDTNDVMSSSGSFDSIFIKSRPGDDMCLIKSDVFRTETGKPARAVEPRNTPTTINAIFYHRSFWDMRAKNKFNGKGVFGMTEVKHDPSARVLEYDAATGSTSMVAFALDNAALASQAVGPPTSNLEMSCEGRTLLDLGREMLRRRTIPLKHQKIDKYDSLFGIHGPKGLLSRGYYGKGLKLSYAEMIRLAFDEKYWAAGGRYRITKDGQLIEYERRKGYKRRAFSTQMQHNFSLFWGIAVMLYEADLVSDRSRWDRINATGCVVNPPGPAPTNADACVEMGLMTEQEADGVLIFFNGGFGGNPQPAGGRCNACHSGPLFAGPGVQFIDAEGVVDNDVALEPVTAAAAGLSEQGTFGTGNRPVQEDKMVGGLDPWGEPLSYGRQIKRWLQSGGAPEDMPTDFPMPDLASFCPTGGGGMGGMGGMGGLTGCVDGTLPTGEAADGIKITVDSKSKNPGLRNIALTPPYFSYGGYATLRQVMEFYARGGNRMSREAGGDTCGSGVLGDSPVPVAGEVDSLTNCSIGVTPLDLAIDPENGKDQEYGIDAVVAFMLMLTDERVQCDEAPFDHPSLTLFHGHKKNGKDIKVVLPAVGAHGYGETKNAHLCIPNSGDLFADGMQNRVDPRVKRHD